MKNSQRSTPKLAVSNTLSALQPWRLTSQVVWHPAVLRKKNASTPKPKQKVKKLRSRSLPSSSSAKSSSSAPTTPKWLTLLQAMNNRECQKLWLSTLSNAPDKRKICICITTWIRDAVSPPLSSATVLSVRRESTVYSTSWSSPTPNCTVRCSSASDWRT